MHRDMLLFSIFYLTVLVSSPLNHHPQETHDEVPVASSFVLPIAIASASLPST
jgi:hypothetical protein